jgi:hypothetical protein
MAIIRTELEHIQVKTEHTIIWIRTDVTSNQIVEH